MIFKMYEFDVVFPVRFVDNHNCYMYSLIPSLPALDKIKFRMEPKPHYQF